MEEFEERKEVESGVEQPEEPANGGLPEANFAEKAEGSDPGLEEDFEPDGAEADAEGGGTRPQEGEEEESGDEPATETYDEPDEEPKEPEEPEEPQQRMFTQEEVNAILSKRIGETKERAYREGRESALGELRGKWGVDSDEDLDALFGDGQRYPTLSDEYRSAQKSLSDLKGENALLKAGVPAERWDDVRAIVAYQGGELTEDVVAQLMQTHPEWSPKAKGPHEPNAEYGTPERPIVAKEVERIGRDRSDGSNQESQSEREYEDAMRYMGL